MNDFVMKAASLSVKMYGNTLLHGISFTVFPGEQWAITGHSGVGKTTLLETLAGKHFYHGSLTLGSADARPAIVYVAQQHHFKNLSNTTQFYYQQRFNASDAEDAVTVAQELQRYSGDSADGDASIEELIGRFHLQHVLDEKLIMLSNGENKRLQIAGALLQQPDILLLDNPFIGLDTEARDILETVLDQIAADGIHIIMATSQASLPSFITHVLSLAGGGNYTVLRKEDYIGQAVIRHGEGRKPDADALADLLKIRNDYHFEFAVRMQNVHISYDNRKILDNINWEIRRGERWSLSGPNGAGKSTLLSLINADNPQAYANRIFLFDRRRGTGETIWDIKKKIGYVSPELHLHFDQTNTAFEVVASGLFDTIGLFRQVSDEQAELVAKWMDVFQISQLSGKMMHRLSNSEQRMVLLARALVKDPPVLILDEPCQGLDEDQVETFKALVNEICIQGNKTLIYVSHYPHEIPQCVSHFARIERGKFV